MSLRVPLTTQVLLLSLATRAPKTSSREMRSSGDARVTLPTMTRADELLPKAAK